MITVLQELEILNHDVGPKFLESLIHQVAMGEGVAFYTGYKEFPIVDEVDDPINTEAQSYLNKMLGVIALVNRVDSSTIKSLQKIEVSLIGNSDDVTWVQITGDPGATPEPIPPATDEQWEAFIADNMIRTFELLGRVLKTEKAAYDAL